MYYYSMYFIIYSQENQPFLGDLKRENPKKSPEVLCPYVMPCKSIYNPHIRRTQMDVILLLTEKKQED